MEKILEAMKPNRELEILKQSMSYSSQLHELLTPVHLHSDMKALIDSMKPSGELARMLDAMQLSKELKAFIESMNPTREFQELLESLQPTQQMKELIRFAQGPLSPSIQELIREATMSNKEILDAFSYKSDHLNRIIESFKQDFRIIGEYLPPDITDEKADEDFKESVQAIIIPDEAKDRIVKVEFLPFHVLEEIRRKPEFMRKLSARDLERMTAELLDGLGFENILLTPMSGDGGRDVVATRHINGIPVMFAFECKRYAEGNHVQLETLRALLGTVAHGKTQANIGVLVTTSTFTTGSAGSF